VRHDDVYLYPDEIRCVPHEPVGVPIRPAGVDENVLPFDIAKLA